MSQDKPTKCVLYIKMMTPVSLSTFTSRLEFFIKTSHQGCSEVPKIKIFQLDSTIFTVTEEVAKFEKYTDFPYWMIRLVMLNNQINSKAPPIDGLGKLYVDVERPSQTSKEKSREDVTAIFQAGK